MNLTKKVQQYIVDHRPHARAEMRFYKSHTTLADAITVAARSLTPRGVRHSHQCRIPGEVLARAERVLLRHRDQLAGAESFEELHSRVAALIGGIRGIGDLAVYDIAHRIGAFRGLEPELIYLHAGTKRGAKLLGIRGEVVPRDRLPEAFAPLTAAEIEDCLCHLAHDLDPSKAHRKSCATAPRPPCGRRFNGTAALPSRARDF